MTKLQIPQFDKQTLKFTGYTEVEVKDEIDNEDYNKIMNVLPGTPQGYCPAIYTIGKTKEPIEITRFYDTRQNPRRLKGYYVTVVETEKTDNMKIKKGMHLSFEDVEKYADPDYIMEEYGPEVIGENFIVLKHTEKDITHSFVLCGATGNGFIYECVYTD